MYVCQKVNKRSSIYLPAQSMDCRKSEHKNPPTEIGNNISADLLLLPNLNNETFYARTRWTQVLNAAPGSLIMAVLDSLVVRIPACHAGGRGSIPRRGGEAFKHKIFTFKMILNFYF